MDVGYGRKLGVVANPAGFSAETGSLGEMGTRTAMLSHVRTFKILAAGWVIGAVFLVLLAGPEAQPRQVAEATGVAGGAEAIEVALEPSAAAGTRAGAPGKLIVPVQGVEAEDLRDDFTQPRGNGRTHGAIDILAPLGTPVLAAADGTIRKLFTSRAGGLTIYQFDRDEQRLYYYAHLDRYHPAIAEGTFVEQGTVIGYVGTTGNARGTPHLHFSVEDLPPTKEWWKGTPVNPYPLLR